MKKNIKAIAVKLSEKEIQVMAENECIVSGIRFFRIPDKLQSFLANYAPVWVRIFVAKYLSGTPDMMLFRKISSGDNLVRFIEIKTEKGKLSESQIKWHHGLNVHVTHGLKETLSAIISFNEGNQCDTTQD